jgi:ribosomal protein L37AE/L43A
MFHCDVQSCTFSSAYERNLKAHTKEVHLKEKRVHKCNICNRFKSSRRSNLTQHIR